MIKVVERIVMVSVRDSCHNVSELLNNDWIYLNIEIYLIQASLGAEQGSLMTSTTSSNVFPSGGL
jgi:acyl-CoA thioesterase